MCKTVQIQNSKNCAMLYKSNVQKRRQLRCRCKRIITYNKLKCLMWQIEWGCNNMLVFENSVFKNNTLSKVRKDVHNYASIFPIVILCYAPPLCTFAHLLYIFYTPFARLLHTFAKSQEIRNIWHTFAKS